MTDWNKLQLNHMLKNQYIVNMMNNFENLQLSCGQNLFSNTLSKQVIIYTALPKSVLNTWQLTQPVPPKIS